MSEAIFCPVCHHKNTPDAKVCTYCDTQLSQEELPSRTTEKVGPAKELNEKMHTLVRRHLPRLPENAFALFVMDDPEPMIIKNCEAVYLGRFGEDPTTPSIDLTKYGAVELGVSRSHARINWADGRYTLEDLASTNGTWLNRQRLAYGKSYDLHNGDSLLLGRLLLTICLMESPVKKGACFEARRTKSSDTVRLQILTPRFMETTLSKFLQAIVDIYAVCLLCSGQTPEDVHVLSIKAVDQTPALQITLDNAEEAARLIRKWLASIRRDYSGVTSLSTLAENGSFQEEIQRAAENILLDVNPALEDDLQKELVEKLKLPLVTLVVSELELSQLE